MDDMALRTCGVSDGWGEDVRIVSLCAGAGGLDLGLRLAMPGARGVAFVEREAYAAATLVARMESKCLHAAPVWSDLATFDGRPWRGRVHIVTSGDPCQPNSVAGKRGGADDDRFLIDQVLRIVDEIRPIRLFRENVPGNADGQLAAIVPPLERMGYRVAAGVFSSRETGNSHGRRRLFIMADRLGDADSPDAQRRLAEQLDAQRREIAPGHAGLASRGLGGVPIIVPGPSDARWADLLRDRPEFAPAIDKEAAEYLFCRGLDAVANRVDRLRLGGNGVDPVAAAYAWLCLDALFAADASASAAESF